MPTLIQSAGVRGRCHIGLLTAMPYSARDRRHDCSGPQRAIASRERRWHAVMPMLIGAVGLTASALAGTHTVVRR